MKILTLIITVLSLNTYAHEDHSAPGSIPPAPNGGVIKEAQHMHHGSHKHDHMEASEREIFFEGVYKKGVLNLYPLELDPKGHKHYITLKNTDFKEMKIEVVDARKKAKVSSKFKVEKEGWSVDVSKMRARRFIIHISGIFKNAKYHAKVQVEKK
jgi:hypothetical protein